MISNNLNSANWPVGEGSGCLGCLWSLRF